MTDPSAREPAFNAPWTVAVLVAALVVSFLAQGTMDQRQWLAWALRPVEVLRAGRWETLVATLFLHSGWLHLLMNGAAALAFGAPVARLFGMRAGGALTFFLFYILCGIISGLGYVLLHPDSAIPVVGASGAISALMGGASRLVDRGGELGPIVGRTPMGMALAWVAVNLMFGLTTLTPGSEGMQIAWEAHLVGYFAGLLLIGPFARALRRA